MEETPRHAIVFGASGLIGWAVVDQLLRWYPEAGTFSKITAVTNRPVKLSESHWPGSGTARPNLQLISGVDLRHGDGVTLANSLKQAVEDIDTVTHLFYLGMSQCKMSRRIWSNKYKFSLQPLMGSTRSQQIAACYKTSSMLTTCLALISNLWYFLEGHE